jgi:hypothetical protein
MVVISQNASKWNESHIFKLRKILDSRCFTKSDPEYTKSVVDGNRMWQHFLIQEKPKYNLHRGEEAGFSTFVF